MPPGFEEVDKDGRPLLVRIEKPIYGIPQSGRRLQRSVWPWLAKQGLKPLDDSDTCVWVPIVPPPSGETFACGVYVDNLQLVHSAVLDDNGDAVDKNSLYHKFTTALRTEWNVVDEGEMEDLLAIQVRKETDGSITLHQEKYIEKVLERFEPERMSRVQKASTPYSEHFGERTCASLSATTSARQNQTIPSSCAHSKSAADRSCISLTPLDPTSRIRSTNCAAA